MKKEYWGVFVSGTIDVGNWTNCSVVMKSISQLKHGRYDKNMLMVF